jgi:hypothetical protein
MSVPRRTEPSGHAAAHEISSTAPARISNPGGCPFIVPLQITIVYRNRFCLLRVLVRSHFPRVIFSKDCTASGQVPAAPGTGRDELCRVMNITAGSPPKPLMFMQPNKAHAVAILTPHTTACAVLFGLPDETPGYPPFAVIAQRWRERFYLCLYLPPTRFSGLWWILQVQPLRGVLP